MPLFRKKPVVVEARFFESYHIAHALADWCGGRVYQHGGTDRVRISIQTLEGTMDANVGDFIIKGVQGEFYPIKSDIFCATYEEVE